MTDRGQQLRLLRHLSKEKLAWYGGRPGAQAPQLPQVGVPDASSAPNATATSTGGTLAAQATNRASEASANIQQNLSDKMQPLKQVGEPVRPASQPTARNRNDRMARQVTQPSAGKTSLAHVVSPAEITKTAQSPFWNKATRVAEDAQRALASPVQSIQEGMREIPAVRRADNWMSRNVGRDPVTWTSQEVVRPALQAGVKAMNTKIPYVNATPAQGLAAVGEGMTGMPVVGPAGMGLRGAGMELQAMGRATRALPGVARAMGSRAVQFGDDVAARTLSGMVPQPAFAGAGGRVAGAEARAVVRAPRVPTQFMNESLDDLAGRATTPAAQVAETAADAVRQRPTVWQSLTGGGPGMPPRTPSTPRPDPRRLAENRAGLVQQYQRTDITGRGPGANATDPVAMANGLKMMGFESMSGPERAVRRLGAGLLRPFTQVPMPPTTPLGPDVSRLRQAGQDFVRRLPLVGPALGGPGLLRNADGTLSVLAASAAAGAGAGGRSAGAPVNNARQAARGGATSGDLTMEQLSAMTPEERRRVIYALAGKQVPPPTPY